MLPPNVLLVLVCKLLFFWYKCIVVVKAGFFVVDVVEVFDTDTDINDNDHS